MSSPMKSFEKLPKNVVPDQSVLTSQALPPPFALVSDKNKRPNPKMENHLEPKREKSAFGKDTNHCLCAVLRPILIIGQVYGILPVTINRPICKISHSWISIPSFISLVWILGNVYGFLYWYPKFYKFMGNNLHGTDFYTQIIALTVQLLSTVVLFMIGNSSASEFTKGWDNLHSTVDEMAMKNFKVLKYIGYLIPIFLTQDMIAYFFLVGGAYLTGQDAIDDISFGLHGATFMTNFIPNVSIMIFILLCYIVSKNFNGINLQLQELGRQFPDPMKTKGQEVLDGQELEIWPCKKIAKRLARLRILHENLCGAVRNLQAVFGQQMIVVFSGSGVSFVIGVYGLATSTQSLDSASKNMLMMIYGYALNTIFSGLRIILVICSCQVLKNNANEAGNILNLFYIDESSEETKLEVGNFLKKVGLFPVRISALGVFELGSGYLASAASNVITYVLVLMQFKLDQSPDETTEDTFQNETSLGYFNYLTGTSNVYFCIHMFHIHTDTYDQYCKGNVVDLVETQGLRGTSPYYDY